MSIDIENRNSDHVGTKPLRQLPGSEPEEYLFTFRCKGITEKLLDFSRLGDVEKQKTNLTELVQGVIDMVGHLGKYQEKKIEFHCEQYVVASVNAQEIKQVVLNLITNALDNLEPNGLVRVSLQQQNDQAELLVQDNGCGMTEEVMRHLFEPFFTRRRDGDLLDQADRR